MPSLITLQGIDETLDNLELKQGTLKAELARVIRSYFVDDHSVQSITSIPTDEIVLKIWGPCQAEELKAKKKNLSSLKSALNKSLKDLDKAGKNQAGIILGRDNVFIVSEERKDDLLKQMGLSPNSPHLLHDMFAAFKKFFSENIKDQNTEEVKDLLAEFEKTQKKLRELSGLDLESIREKNTIETAEPTEASILDAGEEAEETDTVETIELLDGDELEVIEGSEEIEVLDEEVEILDADELEEVVEEETPPGEGLDGEEGGLVDEGLAEEVEVLDADTVEEAVGEDLEDRGLLDGEVEILDTDKIEEVLEEGAPPGEGLGAEEGGPAEGEPTEEVEVLDADTVEEVVGEDLEDRGLLDGEVEILDAGEIEEVLEEGAPPGEGLGAEEGGPAEGEPTEEVEVLDADTVEEVVGEDLEDRGLLDGEVEILDAGEIEEVLEEGAPPGEGLGAEEGGPAEGEPTEEVEVLDADTVEEVVDEDLENTGLLDGEVEILDTDEIEEVLEEGAPPGEGLGAEEGGPAEGEPTEEVEVLDADTVEEVVDEDLEDRGLLDGEVEILDTDEIEEVLEEGAPPGEGLGAEEGGPAEGEPTEEVEVLDADTVEEVVDEDLEDRGLLDGEVEILEEEDLEEIEESAEPTVEKPHQPTPLEVLSKYIEAEEAVNQGDLLRETQEEFINQILERFMPKFIKIPAGVYLVGSASPKGLEQPLRKVMLHNFYLGQSPVTNDLFEMFVRETGFTTDAEEAGYGIVFEGRCTNRIDPETGREIFSLTRGTLARHVSGANWRHPEGPGSSLEGKHNHPVVQVSHNDAMAFASWAGKRLPTEEEWEAAARGASGRLFPWGDRWLPDLGNFEAACLGGTTSVEHFGRKAMSPFGIYDLLGNAAEWTSSPHAGQADTQPGRSAERIYLLKGGSWITGGTVTAAWRQIERGKYWTNTIGFRCAV